MGVRVDVNREMKFFVVFFLGGEGRGGGGGRGWGVRVGVEK